MRRRIRWGIASEGYFNRAILERWLAFCPLHVESRGLLGDIYSSSPRVRDYKKAFEHLSIAATQGNPDAQTAIAYMHRDGEGVAKDDQKAFFWMERAARLGHHPCDQRRLGMMYEHGSGVERNLEKEEFLYQQAADQGGYFERSEMTGLQKRVTGIDGGYCKHKFLNAANAKKETPIVSSLSVPLD